MSRTIEITILSAENLHVNKKYIKKKALFVSLQSDSISSDICCCSTKVNSEEGGFPSWNEKLVMELPLNARFITAEVKCKAASRGVNSCKSIGMARIPVSDFLDHIVQENQVQFLSYRLRDSEMRRNGVINVSVSVKVPEYSLPVTGMPVAGDGSTRVVIGVPVWLSNL